MSGAEIMVALTVTGLVVCYAISVGAEEIERRKGKTR